MKEEANSYSLIQKKTKTKKTQKTSQHILEQYYQAMSIQDSSKLQSIKSELLQNIKQDLIYREQADQSEKLQIKIIRFTKRYECIQLQAKLGKIIFPNINLININLESHIHLSKKIGQGGFSQIYNYQHNHQDQVVKCYPRKKWGASQNILTMIVKEYCLLKMASALKVGPKMKDLQGFDIIAYKDCYEFRMQYCNDPCEKSNIDLQFLGDQLKENLLKLHAFKFIHNDIKVDNIAFSPFFNRYIFIDFNLSRIINQGLGFKTFTTFRGTPNYSSSQMAALCQSQEAKFIDLYYNDLVGLKKSLDSLKEKIQNTLNSNNTYFQQYFQEKSISSSEQITPEKCIIQLIFYIFQQDLNSIKNLDISPLSQGILDTIITFLSLQYLTLKNRAIKELLIRKSKFIQSYQKGGQMNFTFNQSDQRIKITLKMLLCVNKEDSSEYYINQMRFQRKQEILQLFTNKNINITDIISRIDYMHIISKAIQINSSPFTLQQVQRLCHKAIITLLKGQKTMMQCKTDFLVDDLAFVSLFIFQQSWKNRLEGKYFKIFKEILVNIIVCKVVSIDRINTIYQEILQMELSFQDKVLLLLKIKNSILWLIKQNKLIDNDCLLSTQNQIDDKLLQKAILQKKHTQKQLFILKIIFNHEKYFDFQQISSQYKDFGFQLINQVTIFDLSSSLRFQSQTNDRKVSLFMECLQKRYQYDFTSFDRYQFKLIKIIMLQQEYTKLQKIYENYVNTFRFRVENGYKKLLEFYLVDKIEWQISTMQLSNKIKYLQELLPEVSSFEHMTLFKFIFLAFRVHLNKIKTQCKEMIQVFYHFLTKLLSLFTQSNLIKCSINPLNLIIEKLSFYEFMNRKGIKIDKNGYNRSECYQDYMSIDRNESQQNQKYPNIINRLLVLSMILYLLNKQYEAKCILTKIIRVYKNKPEILQYILQFIFYKIYYRINHFSTSSFITNCALIYDQVLSAKGIQSMYLLNNTLFDEILMVLFLNNQERCIQLIKKMSNQVYSYPSFKNIKVYFDSIQRFFEKTYFRQNFKIFYQRLTSQIDINENPFLFIINYSGFKIMQVSDINTIYRQFLKCVPFFGTQPQGIFLSYLNIIYIDKNNLNIRKRSFLYRQSIRFRFFSITLREVLRLFMKQQSRLLMKSKNNHQKYVFLKQKMRYLLINPIRNNFKMFQQLACKWNRIYSRRQDIYKQAI